MSETPRLRCPVCDSGESRVLDTLPSRDGKVIRRRRICPNKHRYTTREHIRFRVQPAAWDGPII